MNPEGETALDRGGLGRQGGGRARVSRPASA